nr:LTA synthase family protein [Prevotella sp.]
DRGLVSILSGWPAFPKTSVMKMPSKVTALPSLAKSLAPQGYASTFLYGGDIDFTNTRGYLLATGTQTIVSEDDFTSAQRGSSKWGVCDSIAFDRLYSIVSQKHAPDSAAFTAFLTLSSHEPWTVPMPTKFSDEVLNSFYYLDLCLGRFLDRLRQSPQWQNTLVIILPDHGIKYQDIDETNPLRAHIPMMWTGGAIRGPRRVSTFCAQSDLAATLLGQLGIAHADYPFSRDIFSPRYTYPFAMHTHSDGFSMVDASGFHAYDLNSNSVVKGKDGSSVRIGKAILQTTAEDLRRR